MIEEKKSRAKQYKIGQATDGKQTSKLSKYQELVLGQYKLGALIKYELITSLISWVPGALGLFLRSKLYPLILGRVGKNVIFGTNIVFRHPHKIEIGDNVIIDDNCLVDAKGSSNSGINIGNNVYLGRNSILSCKDGDILLKDHVNIGFNCEIFSSSKVVLEEYALLAAYCYIVGGGNYSLEKTGRPISEQPVFDNRGIVLEKNCWLGARVTVLDGSRIGHDSAIGASSLVNSEISPFSIAVGIPAKMMKARE
jgi:acetyltransferase-like isoleucine patch superfamily enzyme